MDQNSGDVEPNNPERSIREQFKKKYHKDEKAENVMSSDLICVLSSPDPPTVDSKVATVFNVGATPFISSSTAVHPKTTTGDNNRMFCWNGIVTTSTPINGCNSAEKNDNQLKEESAAPKMKNAMDLANGLNSLYLGPSSAVQPILLPQTRQMKTTSIPSAPAPMPGNVLRHLNNYNNTMGNLLEQTNPPQCGILGPRSGTVESCAYFNNNLINGNNDQLMGSDALNRCGSVDIFQRGLAGNNQLSTRFGLQQPQQPPPLTFSAMGGTNNNNNGLYHYRFDLENNNRQRNQPKPVALPSINFANPTIHHGGAGSAGAGLPSQAHYGENHFIITHQNGIIQLKLKDGIEIEMTLDGAIRVVNWRCNVSISLASSSNSAALIHPNGRVLQYHSRVEIMTYDGKNKNNFVRFAKIWCKGISFTSENNALVYLVDSGGTRTTTDTFMDLRNDITEQVFLTGSTHGPAYDNQAKKEVMNHKYWPALDGTEVHELNGFRIAQTVDGMVRITKANKNILVRTSPGNGSATLTTAYIHCTASLGQTSHLFVRRGERRMHFDGAEFVVRNSGHSAGFDANNLLRVY